MASRFELYYGGPGSAKSRSIMALIEHIHKTTGKGARVYVGDGSAVMYNMSPLTQSGIIKLMEFAIREQPFTTLQQISEGWWPVDPLDPQSKMRRLTPQEVAETGVWVFEGISVGSAYMMGDIKGGLAQRAADGEVIGQDVAIRIVDTTDSNYKFGGNSGAHYGMVQTHILQDIRRTKAMPGMVIWTTHERMDDGERGGAFVKGSSAEKVRVGEKLIGPEVCGKALTSTISREFGNTLHFTIAGKKIADGTDASTGKTRYVETTDYRIYTRDHYDPDGIVGLKYMAVNRALHPAKVKDYYSSSVEAPGQGLLTFYSDLELANN